MTNPVSLETVERLHKLASFFHSFIYFNPEAAAEYEAVGAKGFTGYFTSRAAPMGPVPPEVVIATFYNFSPAAVHMAMDGAWDRLDPTAMQQARWRGAKAALDATAGTVLSDAEISRAIEITRSVCDELDWSGRPLAAANYAVLDDVDPGDHLLVLWQLVTIIREWRGDAHIGVLIAEPLTGTECTVVTHAMHGGFTKASRAWPEDEWNFAVANLANRGWLTDEDTLTEYGKSERQRVEQRTNELAAAMWRNTGEETASELGDILDKAVDALRQGGYLKPLGLRPDEA